MSTVIHPTAIIGKNVSIGDGTQVGAFAVIDEGAVLGKNCRIHEHAIVRGCTTMGDGCEIFSFSVVGGPPQHLGYKDEPTKVVLGNRVKLRESVTVNRGTAFGNGVTTIGDDTYIMAYGHVAHDCSVGKNVILANAIALAGHVEIQDYVTIGGQSGVAQFCRVGRYCYIGGGTIMRKDVAPFLVGKGGDFAVQGINVVGLTRRGFSTETVRQLKDLYKIFFIQKNTIAAASDKALTEIGETDEVKVFLDFIKTSKEGLHR